MSWYSCDWLEGCLAG